MDSERRKLNLQGLLKFAVEQTKAEDAANPPSEDFDEESYKFLLNAMKSMTVNVIAEFEKAVAILENESSTKVQKIEGFGIIRNYIEDLDLANNFVKFGGTKTVLRYLSEPDKDLRALAILVVAEMTQNNPYCQNHFLNEKAIPLLMSYFNDADGNVAGSSVFAISTIIRNFEPGLIEFLRLDGIKALLPNFNSSVTKVYIKTVFLIASLASNDDAVRDAFVKQETIPALLAKLEINNEFDNKLEATLFALAALSTSGQWKPTPKERKEAELLLKQIISANKELENCEEILTYAENVLENIQNQENN